MAGPFSTLASLPGLPVRLRAWIPELCLLHCHSAIFSSSTSVEELPITVPSLVLAHSELSAASFPQEKKNVLI